MVLILQFVNMIYYIDWFVYVEESLCPWDKSHLSMVYDPFNVLLGSICWCFVEDICVYVHQWHWPSIFFFAWYLCLVLVLGEWWPHRMSFGVFLLWNFWRSLRKIDVNSSLSIWLNSPVKPSGPGLLFFFLEIFDHSFNFSACN